MAMLIQVLCNVHRDSQQRLQPFELGEVLAWLGYPPEADPPTPPPAPPPVEELREKLRMASEAFSRSNGSETQ